MLSFLTSATIFFSRISREQSSSFLYVESAEYSNEMSEHSLWRRASVVVFMLLARVSTVSGANPKATLSATPGADQVSSVDPY